jgi:hypothetical protein
MIIILGSGGGYRFSSFTKITLIVGHIVDISDAMGIRKRRKTGNSLMKFIKNCSTSHLVS